jgi:hypothetical protein
VDDKSAPDDVEELEALSYLSLIEDKEDSEEMDRDEPLPENDYRRDRDRRHDPIEGDSFEGEIEIFPDDYAFVVEAYAGPDVVQELEDSVDIAPHNVSSELILYKFSNDTGRPADSTMVAVYEEEYNTIGNNFQIMTDNANTQFVADATKWSCAIVEGSSCADAGGSAVACFGTTVTAAISLCKSLGDAVKNIFRGINTNTDDAWLHVSAGSMGYADGNALGISYHRNNGEVDDDKLGFIGRG